MHSLRPFARTARSILRFSSSRSGCELLARVHEFIVTYRNSPTIVSISAGGYGATVNVGLGRVARDRYESEYYLLDKLLFIRQRLVGPGGLPANHDQEFQVQHYAKALSQHGADILQGDFEIWSKSRKQAWPRKRSPNKKK